MDTKLEVVMTTLQSALPEEVMQILISSVPTEIMLAVISLRGGHPGALADAALLCVKKSQDYNRTTGTVDIHTVDRSRYFPFGVVSYAQMLHTKSERFISLTKAEMAGEKVNFEGLRDTALDIINYGGFYAGDPRYKNK